MRKKPICEKNTSMSRRKSAKNVEFVLTFQLVAYGNTVDVSNAFGNIFEMEKKHCQIFDIDSFLLFGIRLLISHLWFLLLQIGSKSDRQKKLLPNFWGNIFRKRGQKFPKNSRNKTIPFLAQFLPLIFSGVNF
jgi:hypothetical protein